MTDAATHFERLPNLFSRLQQFTLQARQLDRRSLTGGHTSRQRGQSLEFYDYAAYTPGDDTRHLDWRVSVRVHGIEALYDPSKWLLREFVAENELRLLISIDNRESMHYPLMQQRRSSTGFNISKLQAALWLAEALTFIARSSKDRVIWQPLFIPTHGASSYNTRSLADVGAPFAALQHPVPDQPVMQQARTPDANSGAPRLNLQAISQHLKPAFIWLVISDFYFEEGTLQALADRVRSAQASYLWVILLDMDSWPYEAAQLGDRYYRIQGPGLAARNWHKLRTRRQHLSAIAATISEHKRAVLENRGTSDYSHWAWPEQIESREAFVRFFTDTLTNDRYLQRIFMKEK